MGIFPAEAQPVAGTWTLVGGSPILNGEVSISPNNAVTGAIEVVAADPGDPRTLWIGTVNGGVFRTEDADQNAPQWTPLTDHLGALSVGALDLDPTTPATTLVFGVGNTSSYGIGSPLRGLFRSTDRGDTWTSLDSKMVGKNVKGVVARGQTVVACIDSADSGFVEDTGLYRSTNGGTDFKRVDDAASRVPFSAFCLALAGDPSDDKRLFAALIDVGGDRHGVYSSPDSGATWQPITCLQKNASAVELSVGAAGQALFVATCDSTGRLADITRTTDNGATWTLVGRPGTLEDAIIGIHPGGQCRTHFSLAAHPTDPEVVFVGGDRQPSADETVEGTTFPNSIGARDFGARLFRGQITARRARWTSLTYCPPSIRPSPFCGVGSPSDGSAPHADSRHMLFTAAGQLLQTDDGGIYLHSDPNGTHGRWRSLNGNLSLNEQHDIAYDPISDTVIVGNQDNGTARQISPNNPVWELIIANQVPFSGDGGDVAIAVDDPIPGFSTRYFSGQFLQGATRAQFDNNNQLVPGTVFELMLDPFGLPGIKPQFVTPLVINGGDPTRLLLGGENGVFESFDRGDAIRKISDEKVSTSGGRAICYGNTANPDLIYFGTSNGVFSRLSGSATPTRSTSYPGRDAVGCSLDPSDAQRVFVVGESGVFESRNGTWHNRSGDLLTLDPGELRSIALIPGPGPGDDRVAVGSREGVFIAFESEAFNSWRRLGSDLPPAPVFELIYDPSDDILIAGTLGRGAHAFRGARAVQPPVPVP